MVLIKIFSDYLTRFKQLKDINPKIVLLVGLGGIDQGTSVFHDVAAVPTRLSNYMTNVFNLVDTFKLDGIDFDWQYPGINKDWIEQDRIFFIDYLREFRTTLGNDKVISVSVAAKPEDIDRSYNVPEMINYVDFINLKTYNMRGTPLNDNSYTAFHSPLYSRSTEIAPQSEWNVNAIVGNWNIQAGKDISDKLMVGIATFGRSFELTDSSDFGVGAPANGIGEGGSVLPIFNDFDGFLSFREICRGILNDNWNDFWDAEQQSSYAVFNVNQWVGYESLRSAVSKITYVRDSNIGGVNFIRLELDDFGKKNKNFNFTFNLNLFSERLWRRLFSSSHLGLQSTC